MPMFFKNLSDIVLVTSNHPVMEATLNKTAAALMVEATQMTASYTRRDYDTPYIDAETLPE